LAEIDVGSPVQDKIEGIRIQVEVFQGWSTWRGKWPSPRVKSTRNEEYCKGKDRRGGWQTKVVSVIPEMEWNASGSIADVGQFHPRMNQEELAHATSLYMTGTEVQAPGKAPALLSKVFQVATSKLNGNRG